MQSFSYLEYPIMLVFFVVMNLFLTAVVIWVL
uniref:Uncharacterized protein n=1 Tax=Arundo donax TaxID=35708 RepID=A0A0A8YCB0_ARUDO